MLTLGQKTQFLVTDRGLCWRTYGSTLRLKSIRPFADFSYNVIFDWSKMWVEMIENSPILQNMPKYICGNLYSIFPVVLKIQAFKGRSFRFYFTKCQFFGNFDCEGMYS